MGENWRTRGVALRDSMLMALAVCGVARGSEALAAETAPSVDLPRLQLAVPLIAPPSLQRSFAAPPLRPEPESFSATEFRPRKRGILEINAGVADAAMTDMPRLQDNSFARQIKESKSQDRVRLLTLWQSSVSSISLQAGKGGAPSLQWSTPWMHRSSGSRGLFDHWLSISPRGAFGAPRSSGPRQAAAGPAAKPLDLAATAKSQ